ncbi:MAG: CPBP family intramembrane metalloprotease [Deltaproteobacteria bacterium]|nr:CPBP family intramembrane metalloprotease [Deltaproteobacteria bacterium]
MIYHKKLLLFVGPVLEEFLFRQAFWSLFRRALRTQKGAWIATALVFAFGHFFAYFFVPPELKSFVIYQTTYAFGLGVWWGYGIYKTGAISYTISLHFLFNFGFFIASTLGR